VSGRADPAAGAEIAASASRSVQWTRNPAAPDLDAVYSLERFQECAAISSSRSRPEYSVPVVFVWPPWWKFQFKSDRSMFFRRVIHSEISCHEKKMKQ
jgi:hypothetical protein